MDTRDTAVSTEIAILTTATAVSSMFSDVTTVTVEPQIKDTLGPTIVFFVERPSSLRCIITMGITAFGTLSSVEVLFSEGRSFIGGSTVYDGRGTAE
jgi:hypothetical protein